MKPQIFLTPGPSDLILVRILGLMRSGTTIVASLFNSIEDALVVSEPHLALFNGESPLPFPCETRYGIIELRQDVSIVQTIVDFAEGAGLRLAGYKEVVSPLWADDVLAIDGAGREWATIVVLRHPDVAYESAQAMGWTYISIREWADTYLRLCDMVESGDARAIIYEDFLKDPLQEASSALGHPITGSPKLIPDMVGIGDEKAKGSYVVNPVPHRKRVKLHSGLRAARDVYQSIREEKR